LSLSLLISGCGKIIPDVPGVVVTHQRVEEADKLLESDPLGPIPKPDMPSGLSSEGEAAPQASPAQKKIAYEAAVECPSEPEGLEEMFKKSSDLFAMMDTPPSSELTLTRRLRSSIDQGTALLKSLGYYEGRVEGSIEKAGERLKVTVRLTPGPLYTLEPGLVALLSGDDPHSLEPAEIDKQLEEEGQKDNEREKAKAKAAEDKRAAGGPCPYSPCPADTLTQAGLVPGAPAKADDVLAAVDALSAIWRNGGYPEAEVVATRYTIDTKARTLLAEAALRPGPYASMGDVKRTSESKIKDGYLAAYVNWKPGQSWSQDLAERYRESLMRSGLFKTVEISPSPAFPHGEASAAGEVLLKIEDAPARTVSGSLNYDTDFGPGLELAWEHRNFTGWGDKLRFEMPVWRDLFQLAASYQRPFFLDRRQNLLLEAAVLKENAKSYDLLSFSAAAGIDRQLTRKIRGVFRASFELGSLEEELLPREGYEVIGLPVTLEWSDANSVLDPTKGMRITLLAAPYYGEYKKKFSVLKYRVDAAFYQPFVGPDKLVMALRAAMGAINGTSPQSLPSSLRFFGGGGKSVRGYEYQSIGPKNARGRPVGGAAVVEASVELRWKFSDTMGVTAFVDGGNVYDRPEISQLGKDLLFGGGLGFRYYSPIGPFRLDLATPLTPRRGDGPIQVYLSLGQSF
jgi:translocation and assembly module TamA